jgi:hypothetical protein
MPLTPYIRPQDTITQILRNTSAASANRRNALVIGPQYKLAINDGRELAKHTFYQGDFLDDRLKYQLSAGGVVTPLDLTAFAPLASSVKVFGENLLAEVFCNNTWSFDVVPGTRNSLRINCHRLAGGTLAGWLHGRAVKVGDIFRVYDEAPEIYTYRKVVALLPAMEPAVIGGVVTESNLAVAGLASGGTYTGTIARRLIIEVTTGGNAVSAAVIKVYDSAGVIAPQTFSSLVAATPVTVLGTGGVTLAAVAGQAGLALGAKYYVSLTPETAIIGEADGVVLDGNVVSASYDPAGPGITVMGLVSYTGEIADINHQGGGVAYTVDADPAEGVSISDDLGLPGYVTGSSNFAYFQNGYGKIFLSYKAAFIPSATEGPIPITGASSIADTLGEVNQENWLGRGAFEALNGASGATIYALRTAGDTVEDFSVALKKIRTNEYLYALAPMTDRLDVMQLVKAHCEETSNKFNTNFRRCYVGCDSPGSYEKWGFLPDGSLRQGTLANGRITLLEEYRAGSSFLTSASVGDQLTMTGLGPVLTITSIVSAYEVDVDSDVVILQGGLTLIGQDTADNTVSFVSQRSAALNSRRCVNVWSDYAAYGSGNVLPMKFVAAEIAGLRCALIPQRGLTMTDLSSVTSAPAMFTKFTPEQLDTIASYGTLIVTQESEGGSVFIRHQLTTDVVDGALAYEDNVGVIVDSFSQDVKDTFRSYRGRRNVTPNTIEDIRVKLKQLAIDYTQAEFADAEYGPRVLRFFDATGRENEVTVRVDGSLADHLETYVKLRVPLPLNGINHYIDVETSVNL